MPFLHKKPKLISLKEAARRFGYTPDYIGSLIRMKKIPGKKVYSGVSWFITEEDLKEYQQKMGTQNLKPIKRWKAFNFVSENISTTNIPIKIKETAKKIAGIKQYKNRKEKIFSFSWRFLLIIIVSIFFIGGSPLEIWRKIVGALTGEEKTVNLYSTTCIGEWQNPQNSQGQPEAGELGDLNSFSESNSAVYKGGPLSLLCQDFENNSEDLKDEDKENLKIQSAKINFSFAIGEIKPDLEINQQPVTEESEPPVEEPLAPAEEPTSPPEEPIAPIEEQAPPVEELLAPSEEQPPLEITQTPAEEPEAPIEEPLVPSEEPGVIEITPETILPLELMNNSFSKIPSNKKNEQPIGFLNKIKNIFGIKTAKAEEEDAVLPENEIPPTETDSPPEEATSNQQQETSEPETENLPLTEDRPLIVEEIITPNIDSKIIIWYSLDNEVWFQLGVISEQPLSNLLNNGYFSFDASFLKNWDDIKNLKIKFEGVIGGETTITAYLDSVWLEISYESQKIEEKEETLEPKKLTKVKINDNSLIIPILEGTFSANDEPTFVITDPEMEATEIVSQGKGEIISEEQIIKESSVSLETVNSGAEELQGTVSSNFSELISNFSPSAKIKNKKDSINIQFLGSDGSEINIPPEVTPILKDGKESFEVKIPKLAARELRPGLYKLRIELETNEATLFAEQDFSWGVLAINSNKSIYLSGEEAYLQMAILSDSGDTICDAPLKIEIKNPQSEITTLTTQDGTILNSETCGSNNVTDKPDYFAYYGVKEIGTYEIKLINLNNDYEIADSFEVRDEVPFDIERIGPTRIYPPANYEMILKIKANEDFVGEIREYVLESFEIILASDMRQETKNGEKIIIWDVDWKKGESYELKYQFNAPDISPQIYLLGPLEINDFKEIRQWYIAVDAITETDLAEGGSTTDALSFTTASQTPSNYRLVLGCVVNTKATLPDVPTLAGNSLTWVQVATQTFNTIGTPLTRVTLFRAMGEPAAGTVVISFGGNTQTGCRWAFSQYMNVDISGTNGSGAIVQSPTNAVDGGASLTIPFATFSSVSNAAYACFGTDTNSAVDPDADWTESYDAGHNTPTMEIETQWRATPDTHAIVTEAADIGGIAVEIKHVTVVLSGTSDQTSGTVKYAKDTVAQTESATISGAGTWTMNIAQPAANSIITVWVDNAAVGDESTAVTKYDGSGDITGMVLNRNVLSVGSANSLSLIESNFDNYDCDQDEDIMHDGAGSILLVEGSACIGGAFNTYSDETITILLSNTLTIAVGETLTTDNLTIAGTLTSSGAGTFNISGNWTNTGTFTKSTETVTFNGAATQVINSGGSSFYNVTLSNNTFTLLTNAMTVSGNLVISEGKAPVITATTSEAFTVTGTTDGTAGTGAETLTVNTTGAVTFTGAVGTGQALMLTTLTITNSAALLFSSTINITGNLVQTNAATGTTTFSNTVAVAAATLKGVIFLINNSFTATGAVAITNSGLLTKNATGAIIAPGGFTTTGAATLANNITTTAKTISIGGALIISDATVVLSTTTGVSVGNITLSSTVDGVAGGAADNLTLTAPTGFVSVVGIVGGSATLGTITLTSSDGTTFQAAVSCATLAITDTSDGMTVAFQGNITATTAMTIAANGTFNVSLTGGTNTIAGATTFNNTGTVTLGDGGDTITFTGGVVVTAPSSITLSGLVKAAGTGVITLGDAGTGISVTGSSTVGDTSTGQITLGAATLSDGVTLTLGAAAATPITTAAITGTASGTTSNLTVSTSGAVIVGGAVGTDIGAITVTNSAALSFNSTINITGALTQTNAATGTTTFAGVVTVGGAATLKGVIFLINNSFAVTGAMAVTNSGLLTKNSTGAITAAGGFSTASTGNVNLSSNITTTNTTLSIGGTLVIGDTLTVTLAAGSGAITVTSTTDGTTGNAGETLIVNTTGAVNFGAVGSGSSSMLTTLTITNSAALTFNSTINITGALTQTNAATGTTTFSSTVAAGSASLNGTTINLGGITTVTGNLTIVEGTLDTVLGSNYSVTAGSLTIKASGILNSRASALDSNGDVTIEASGTLIAPSSSGSFNVGGSWSNSATGIFTHSSGTVIFDATTTGKNISDGGDPFYGLQFTGANGGWTYTDGCFTAPNTTVVNAASGVVNFINAKTATSPTFTNGILNVDWYLGVHVADVSNEAFHIDTGVADITISEKTGTPASTVWRYDGGWGDPLASQTTGTDENGDNPQLTLAGAIRIREYSNNSGVATYYLYNLEIAEQGSYAAYNYYSDFGSNYLTSTANSGANKDAVIGVGWYRETATVGTMNAVGTINEPPTNGSWYCGMSAGVTLEVDLTGTSIDFGNLTVSNNFSATAGTQTEITVSTSATSGYIVTAWETQLMKCSDSGACATDTIQNFTGSYANPREWSGYCKDNTDYCGFGFTSDDNDVGGEDRYSPIPGTPEYTFFPTESSAPVRVMDYDSPVNDQSYLITYRISTSLTQRPGPYETVIVYVVTAQF